MKPQRIIASRIIKLYSPEDLDGITYIQTDLVVTGRPYTGDSHYRYGDYENMPLYQTPASGESYKKAPAGEIQNNNSQKGVSVNVNAVKVNVMTKTSASQLQY